MVVDIVRAEYIKDYRISFEFSDNVRQLIDFEPFLKASQNPMTKKYLDKQMFQDFTIEYGDIVWNDYEMCFPIWDLYNGKL